MFYALMFGIYYSKRGIYVGMAITLFILVLASLFFGESYRWGEVVNLEGMQILLPEPGRFAGFFIGAIVAHLLGIETSKNQLQSVAKTLLPIAIIGVPFCSIIWSIYAPRIGGSYILCNLFYLTASTCFGVIVAYLATNNSTGLLNLILQSTFMRILGQISYSFYLIHALVTLPLSAEMLGSVNSFSEMCLNYIVGFLLTTISATMVFYYFERPYFLSKKSGVI